MPKNHMQISKNHMPILQVIPLHTVTHKTVTMFVHFSVIGEYLFI